MCPDNSQKKITVIKDVVQEEHNIELPSDVLHEIGKFIPSIKVLRTNTASVAEKTEFIDQLKKCAAKKGSFASEIEYCIFPCQSQVVCIYGVEGPDMIGCVMYYKFTCEETSTHTHRIRFLFNDPCITTVSKNCDYYRMQSPWKTITAYNLVDVALQEMKCDKITHAWIDVRQSSTTNWIARFLPKRYTLEDKIGFELINSAENSHLIFVNVENAIICRDNIVHSALYNYLHEKWSMHDHCHKIERAKDELLNGVHDIVCREKNEADLPWMSSYDIFSFRLMATTMKRTAVKNRRHKYVCDSSKKQGKTIPQFLKAEIKCERHLMEKSRRAMDEIKKRCLRAVPRIEKHKTAAKFDEIDKCF